MLAQRDRQELAYKLVLGGMERGVHKPGHEQVREPEHEQQRCAFLRHMDCVHLEGQHGVGWKRGHGKHHEVCEQSGLQLEHSHV